MSEDINVGAISEALNNKVDKFGDVMTGQLKVQFATGNFKAYSTQQELGAVTGARVNGGGLYMYDKNGKQTAIVQSAITADGTNVLQMITRHPDDSAWGAYIEIGSRDGKTYISMPTNQKSQINTWGFPNLSKGVTKTGNTVYQAATNVWVKVQNHTNLGGGKGYLYAGTTSSPTIEVCRWGGNVASGEAIFYPIPKGWYYKATTNGLEGLTEYPCAGEV